MGHFESIQRLTDTGEGEPLRRSDAYVRSGDRTLASGLLVDEHSTPARFAYSIRHARPPREIRRADRHQLRHRANVAHTLASRSLAACGLLARNARRVMPWSMRLASAGTPVGFAI